MSDNSCPYQSSTSYISDHRRKFDCISDLTRQCIDSIPILPPSGNLTIEQAFLAGVCVGQALMSKRDEKIGDNND